MLDLIPYRLKLEHSQGQGGGASRYTQKMAVKIPNHFSQQSQRRHLAGANRSLRVTDGLIDLSSNDYLGVSRKLASAGILEQVSSTINGHSVGATGSRLVSGNLIEHEELEAFLAHVHQAPSALLFGSGYEANIGVLSSVAGRVDTILYDELIHASMRDGIRLSPARSLSFKHNDLDDLRRVARQARGDIFIAVESLYSMDGDFAPLIELCSVAAELNAFLIVDEAHSTGLYGDRGAGKVVEQGVADRVFARIHTFGKAVGYKGACVVGDAILREHLVNHARPFIYSTAVDLVSLRLIREAYRLIESADREKAALAALIDGMQHLRAEYRHLRFLSSDSPIQGVIIPGNEDALRAENALNRAGFAARAIRAPTVPNGEERIRLCLHSFNSIEQISKALAVISEESSKSSGDAVG
jgi:8-amino-7-oxononanoate synthase